MMHDRVHIESRSDTGALSAQKCKHRYFTRKAKNGCNDEEQRLNMRIGRQYRQKNKMKAGEKNYRDVFISRGVRYFVFSLLV
jgi:hypothetical protein